MVTNSPNYRYRLTEETLEMLRKFGSEEWEEALNRFHMYHDTLIDIYASKKKMTLLPVKINDLDFKMYKKFSEALAWETEVWIAEMPEHMIHLDGDMFLGPR